MQQLQAVDELRERATSLLRQIEQDSGAESPIYRGCAALWQRKDHDAFLSLVAGDFENAIAVLDYGISHLALAPQMASNQELETAQVLTLLGAA